MLVQPTVRQPHPLLIDASLATLVAALLYGFAQLAGHWHAPLTPQTTISLSLRALPGYTILSLLRGLVAYGVSLVVAIVYGYVMARWSQGERLLLPLLDVLQSIPVLGFLPSAVLAFVSLFPHTNAGLELASILMIVTGQVWNLAFSFYQSVRAIPVELREASALYGFSWWQRFRRVELPAAAVGLAWNSMMSMAGGWFFLMVCEAFTLGSRDFRLPGLGAYMTVAVAHGDARAIGAGLAAMVLMIVFVDACLWRPVLAWVQRFRIEETAAGNLPPARTLHWLKRSWLVQVAMTWVAHPIGKWLAATANGSREPQSRPRPPHAMPRLVRLLLRTGFGLAGLWAVWSSTGLVRLVTHLSRANWVEVLVGASWTLGRVMAATLMGTLWTVPVGVWIGRSPRWRSRLAPVVQVAASFPAPMLYPLILMLLHGLGWDLTVGATLLMLLGTQWYILFNVIAGASSVPNELREAAQAYRFTPWQWWRVIWWPAVFPYLITGWVTAAGGAWNASIVAEYVVVGNRVEATRGLGSLISIAASRGAYDLLAAGVLSMVVVVLLINRAVWKPLYRFAGSRYAY